MKLLHKIKKRIFYLGFFYKEIGLVAFIYASVGACMVPVMDGDVDVSEEPGFVRVIYDQPYGGLLPTYHRLDISVDRTFPFKGGAFAIQAGVINIYDRANIFALDLFTLERTDQLPLLPTLGLKIDF